ncbi:MAG: SUMF1/EgtB/PvdO family nonheme iron enzyme, partial [Acidobacteriota bacterium]
LPTEAEWERACRAGTQGATWVGELDVVSRNHAPVLDAISWYSGNSGVDFDLEEGRDSSKWEAKQHNHRIAGTREVKRKKPNPWGLFDMLGNVSEWCLDTWIDSYDPGPRSDPLGSGEGPYKVVRGGAFDEDVYDQTAGRRFSYRPNDSTFYIGFRWAAKDD